MSDWAEGTSPLAIPSGSLGSGLYDFGYMSDNLPVSEAAKSASQIESGGSGFDWNKGLGDMLGAWASVESRKVTASQPPLQYRRAENGQLYVTDPAYRGTLGNSSIAGIPTWLLIGGAIVAAVMLAKD